MCIAKLSETVHMYVDNYKNYESGTLSEELLKNILIVMNMDTVLHDCIKKINEVVNDKQLELIRYRMHKYNQRTSVLRELTALDGLSTSSIQGIISDFVYFYVNKASDAVIGTIKDSKFYKTNYCKYSKVEEALKMSDKQLKSVPKQSNVKYIDFKDLIKLAESNDYFYERSNGDHRIYKHNSTGKIVVIPYHNLGQGLSFAIQKQIKLNSVA